MGYCLKFNLHTSARNLPEEILSRLHSRLTDITNDFAALSQLTEGCTLFRYASSWSIDLVGPITLAAKLGFSHRKTCVIITSINYINNKEHNFFFNKRYNILETH